jgi:FlaA1/EpsC-like NDP-sugar epimerase
LGNVLGSSGSVVETFMRQIAAGGPVTISDPEAERYFLTTEEAVDLLLHAAVCGPEGSVIAPRLEPARSIETLAQFLIEWASPDAAVPVEYTGLRPGEKMREMLWSPQESPVTCAIPGCLEITPRPFDATDLNRRLRLLLEAVQSRDLPECLAIVDELVPDYSPSASVLAVAERSRRGVVQV